MWFAVGERKAGSSAPAALRNDIGFIFDFEISLWLCGDKALGFAYEKSCR
jgi:hypothetical protein